MNENIDTSKELVIYQNKAWLILWITMILLIGWSPVIIGVQTTNQNTMIWRYILSAGSVIITLIISRQFFIKDPLLKVSKEGFFTRKTGNVSWGDVSNIDTLGTVPVGTSSPIAIAFKDGRKINISTNNMRLPKESAFNPDRGFGVVEIMQTYRKASGLQ